MNTSYQTDEQNGNQDITFNGQLPKVQSFSSIQFITNENENKNKFKVKRLRSPVIQLAKYDMDEPPSTNIIQEINEEHKVSSGNGTDGTP